MSPPVSGQSAEHPPRSPLEQPRASILSPRLTDEQRQAITHTDGPLLIVAGPGTGKTDVIVRRTAYLVHEKHVDPRNILVTTFTNKATEELYDRLWSFLGRSALDTHISTIHSLCATVLSDFHDHHRWGRHVQILDDQEQFLFVYGRLKELGLHHFPKARIGDFLADVVATFNLCTEELVDPSLLRAEIAAHGSELLGLKKDNPDAVEEYAAVAEAYPRYLELLEGEGALDYAMLQRAAYQLLLDRPPVRDALASRFRYILVDEYQDTNRLQVLLLREIARPSYNLCGVGDDDQSIYRFRGASVRSFLSFEQDFPGRKEVRLSVNFRATQPLVDATNALIAHNEAHREAKEIRAHRPERRPRPVVVGAETCREEAERVVDLIEACRGQGTLSSYSDVALLFRSVKYHAADYLAVLSERQIPFVVAADGGFFDREDILHLRDLMTFCGWKKKWDLSGLCGKLLELSRQTIEAIARIKEDPSTWVEDGALQSLGIADAKDRKALQELARTRLRAGSGEIATLLELFYEVLRATGYFQRCCSGTCTDPVSTECDAALLNLAQFSTLLEVFQRRSRHQSTYHFREYLHSLPDRSLDSLRPDPPGEAVRVMTVHQAKGLEFPMVVVGSAMNGRFPGHFRPPKYPIPSGLRMSRETDDEVQELIDQRRLFYVACTRAQDVLIIGAPAKVAKRGGGSSAFVSEIGDSRVTGPESFLAAPVPIESKVKPRAPLRKRLSYSAIHSYLLCPLQYKLLHDCGFSVPQAYWSRFGQIIHHALETLHEQARRGQEISPATASLILDRVWIPPATWSEENSKTLKETGRQYLIRYCEKHADRFARIHWVEEPLELPVEDALIITGRLDLACTSQDGLEVIDFKVRSRKGMEALRPELQARTYALACQESKGQRVARAIIHLLAEKASSDVVIYDWHDGAASEIRSKLHDAVQGIVAGRFRPTPGPHCALCDFHASCPAAQTPSAGFVDGGLDEATGRLDEPTVGLDP